MTGPPADYFVLVLRVRIAIRQQKWRKAFEAMAELETLIENQVIEDAAG